jgi:hypothetical protein
MYLVRWSLYPYIFVSWTLSNWWTHLSITFPGLC